jgi:predicted small metal-binding protein
MRSRICLLVANINPQHLTFNTMEKVIRCRDVGFDCNGVIKAKTEEEALKLAAEHAMKVHGLKEITPEIVAKVKSVIRTE